MKLQYTDYGIELSLKENSVHRLCIESPQAYAEIVQSLYQQCNGEEGNAILSDGVQPLEFEKYAEILLEPFSLQFDTKKNQYQIVQRVDADHIGRMLFRIYWAPRRAPNFY